MTVFSRIGLFSFTLSLLFLGGGCIGERSAEDKADAGPSNSDDADARPEPEADSAPVGPDTEPTEPDAEPSEPDSAPIPLLALGQACVASAECESGWCPLPCEGDGVCAPAECGDDAECVVDGAENTHCCIGGACRAVAGGACGTRSGTQGDACGTGGASDCADGFACLDPCNPASSCSAGCEDDAACEAIDETLGCFRVASGAKQCVANPDLAVSCGNTDDCPEDAVCTAFVSFDGTGVIKSCQAPWGSRKVGRTCNDSNDCVGALCLDGRCSEGCANDDDCVCPTPGSTCLSQICLDVWFTVSDDNSDAVKLCFPRVRCEATSDCEEGVCLLYLEKTGVSTICDAPTTARVAGDACETNQQCGSGACFEDVCVDLCGGDEHCLVEGETCTESTLALQNGDATVSLCL